MSEDVVKHEPTIMEIVQQIASQPNARDQVEVVKELLALKEHMEDRAAKKAFQQAKQELKQRLPPITKDGKIYVKGVLRSRYTTLDRLDEILKPLMNEFGLDFTVSETGIRADGMREFAGKLTHVEGHSETLTTNLPLDKSDFRTAVQSEGSTISYARRQLLKAHFNLIERNEDDDGSGQNVEPIDAEQLRDLTTMILDVGANLKLFCDYFHITDVRELKKADLARAIEMLQQKRSSKK